VDLRDLRGLDLQAFFNDYVGDRWKYKTRKNCLAVIATFFKWAVRKAELLDKEPSMPNIGEPEQAKIKWLSAEQQTEVLKHLDDKYRPIIQFLMTYGCRPSEAIALQISSIDWDAGIIYIRHSISSSNLVERTKTNRIRSLPILPKIVPLLKTAVKDRIGDGYVFINCSTGRRFGLCPLEIAWREACKNAGCEGYTLQEGTRKKVINDALERGISITDIANALGNLRIPVKSAPHSNGNRQAIPVETGHPSKRSDAGILIFPYLLFSVNFFLVFRIDSPFKVVL